MRASSQSKSFSSSTMRGSIWMSTSVLCVPPYLSVTVIGSVLSPVSTVSLTERLNVFNDLSMVVSALPPKLDKSTDMFLIKRSEEHTSELQSRGHLVCRLLLEKKK